ncbi:MAG: response regulator [Ferruginibacter sp.]
MQTRPIVIVEDDLDDCELLTIALKAAGVKNQFRCFNSPDKALTYLKTTEEKIFIIISDVNMPIMNGLEFKNSINKDECLNEKRIPFVFLSTSATRPMVDEAFKLCANGYFQKPTSFRDLTQIGRSILEYWQNSQLPS